MSRKKPDQALAAELEKLLTDADTAVKDRVALRDAVCAYCRSERAKGITLERIRISVTEILERAEARLTGIERKDGQHELAQQLVDWCVEEGRGARDEWRGKR
jgi:hypothetical protein